MRAATLPSADPRAAQIINTVEEFEASVEAAEAPLVARDWPAIDALLNDQRRLTHALQNALEQTCDDRPQAFTREVERRIAQIVERRAGQLLRLTAYNHAVGSRLKIISRSREMRRVHTLDTPAPRILDSLQ